MYILDIIKAPREIQKLGKEIVKHTKEIRDGVRANGYCLDGICKDFKPKS